MLLAVPAIGFAADEIDWGFRAAFRSYIHSGSGTPPISTSAGATCDPNPNVAKGGCDPKAGVTGPGVFGWTATTFSYDLPDGDGVIESQGTFLFDRPDHFFNLSIIDPIITIADDGTVVVNARVKLVVTMGTTPPVDQRMDLGEFELTTAPVIGATTVTWNIGSGAITNEAATALGGFLAAGDPLDDMRIILPLVEPPAGGTPISSTNLLLKDDPAKPDKRGLTFVVAKEVGVVPADIDPTVNGATVRVVSSTFDDTYVLPASNWTAVVKKGVVAGYKYADSKRVLGPISAAQITIGGIKVTGKGAGLSHALGSEPADVSIVVSSGDDSLCAGVGASSKKTYKTGKLFKGSKNAAPASCPDAPLPG
ncbi:MAG TPA: HtaA domain-containing protein [Candidatus Binatia bacterium]|jgi:hypothetical protein|nr:HtaA domain-containing protein [Candidatus Binatia bacterium]